MKCYLHIGTEKTATTTLQSFFNLNRAKLFEHNVIYTKSAGEANNRSLSVAAYNQNRFDDSTKLLELGSSASLLIFQKQIIEKLKNEITEASDNNSDFKLLFSSEHFQSRLKKIEEIERLKEILFILGATDISVVVYLRRQAEIANSLYSEAIRSGGLANSPPSPTRPHINNICNHKRTLEKFSSVFGEPAIIPRLFDNNEFYEGTIIYDFLNLIGIPYDNSFLIPQNANESLSVLGINILKNLNHTIPLFIDNKLNPMRANLVAYIEKYVTGEKYVMPAHLYKEYDLEFNESNEWVRKKYFNYKKELFNHVIPIDTSNTITEEKLEIITKLISNIWIDKQKIILNLEKTS